MTAMHPNITLRRYPYEEPYHLHLEISASNGQFAGVTEYYCNASDLAEIGAALMDFPKSLSDEYSYEVGSKDNDSWTYFLMRLNVFDVTGHCGVRIEMSKNLEPPQNAACEFFITADTAAINRLGELFIRFAEMKHLELQWGTRLEESGLFESYQNAMA